MNEINLHRIEEVLVMRFKLVNEAKIGEPEKLKLEIAHEWLEINGTIKVFAIAEDNLKDITFYCFGQESIKEIYMTSFTIVASTMKIVESDTCENFVEHLISLKIKGWH